MSVGAQSTFNLQEFQSEVFGKGLSRVNRFEVIIPSPSVLTSGGFGIDQTGSSDLLEKSISDNMKNILGDQVAKKVSLMCESAAFPTVNLQTKPYRIYGVPYQRPVSSEYGGDGVALTFHVDQKMAVKNFFDAWIQSIVQKETYLVSYQKHYVVDIEINQLDEQNKVSYKNILIEAFPRSTNLMEVNNATQNQTHRLIVLFAFRKWKNPVLPPYSQLELKGPIGPDGTVLNLTGI